MTSSLKGMLVAVGLAGAAMLPGTVVLAGPAAAAGCSTATADIGDVDGDGVADLVVGVPKLSLSGQAGAGGIDAFYTSAGARRTTLVTLGLTDPPEASAGFGSAIGVADLDDDGCSDLAVGAPGDGGTGAVYLLKGSPDGVVGTGAVRITAPDGKAGDRFGATVVQTIRSKTEFDLWVGAPGRTVGGLANAGQVYHYLLDASGSLSLVGTASYAGAAVAGSPAAGDRFGEVLMPTDDGVIVGVPRRSVGGKAGAGQIVVLSQRDRPLAAQVFDQSSAGVPGTSERGDHFGAALAGTGSAYLVGIPGEDVGKLTDAGAVDYVRHDDGKQHSLRPTVTGYTQDSANVPGAAEKGDLFGSSVLAGYGLACDKRIYGFSVGAPGEDIGAAKDAGNVVAWALEARLHCASQSWQQGSTLSGAAETGDRLGATQALLHSRAAGSTTIGEDAVIGAPGESDPEPGSGVVETGRPGKTETGPVDGPVAGLAFGAVLGSPAYDDSI